MRPTVFLDGFFRLFAAPGVRDANELALPMGGGKTSPISAMDVARAANTSSRGQLSEIRCSGQQVAVI
jgi:uncharacterized protein YbjT (DUF2867 family)